jgi:hypothetical protein
VVANLPESNSVPMEEVDDRPAYIRENRRATNAEFKKMSEAERMAAFTFTPVTEV